MIHQLRIYEIFDATRSAFHGRFRDHAARLMRAHGFDIRGMWECRNGGRLEFVYLLAWKDEAALETAWTSFISDPEWSRIKQETGATAGGPLVGAIEDRRLVATAYDPRLI
ncbi:MAG: NIPSNAP family protein [Thalassobaculaceae bacterium]|nr:NIPSNAP family protein [Thalassobaculaceae bacterium]